MGLKVSFQGALYFTKLSVYLAHTWPPSITATKWETTKYHILWCLSVLSIMCFLVPLLVSISKYHMDPLIVTQSATVAGGTISIQEMEDFIKNAQPHEIKLCRRYVNRCATFHVFISTMNYVATVVYIGASLLFGGVNLPTNAVYPFPVDAGIGMVVAYVHQSFASLQCSTGITIDCQAALMQWYAGARLDILAEEIDIVKDVKGLQIFVLKHRKLLAYAADVSETIAYIVMTSTMSLGIVAIMSCLQLCGSQPFHVKLQFATLALVSSLNLFICAWPADNLMDACDRLEKAVYNISWIDMSLHMMKNIPMFLQRCQRPVIVSVGGFLPTLSLAFYASFLSAIFSYFTTLRIVMMSDDKN